MSGPILAGALLALPGLAAAEELRSYAVTGDAIPMSLTGAPGDPVRRGGPGDRAAAVGDGHHLRRGSQLSRARGPADLRAGLVQMTEAELEKLFLALA